MLSSKEKEKEDARYLEEMEALREKLFVKKPDLNVQTMMCTLVCTIDTDCTGGIGYANNVWIEYNFTRYKKRKIFNPRGESFKEGIREEFK